MIRHLVNNGFYIARFLPICEHCGEANSRTHVINRCPAFDNLRATAWKKLNEVKNTRQESNRGKVLRRPRKDTFKYILQTLIYL